MKNNSDYNAIIDFKTNEAWTEVKKEVFYEFIFRRTNIRKNIELVQTLISEDGKKSAFIQDDKYFISDLYLKEE